MDSIEMTGLQQEAVTATRARWLILAATCLGMLALGANGTAIMAALPTMRHELGLSGAQLEWAINAYPLRTLGAGNVLIVIGSVVIAAATTGRMWPPLMIGLFAIGIGLALPYATAPRLALSTLPPSRAGAGSGIINACTFLGGSIGVAAGAVAFSFGGLSAAMGLIAVVALVGVWLCRRLPPSI